MTTQDGDTQASISYVDNYGETKTCASYINIVETSQRPSDFWGNLQNDQWYVLSGTRTIDYDLFTPTDAESSVTANIILCDDANITCEGIKVAANTTLNIYRQENGTGKISSAQETNCLVDNKGDFNFYGGTLTGGTVGVSNSGSVTLGGAVTNFTQYGIKQESASSYLEISGNTGCVPCVEGNGNADVQLPNYNYRVSMTIPSDSTEAFFTKGDYYDIYYVKGDGKRATRTSAQNKENTYISLNHNFEGNTLDGNNTTSKGWYGLVKDKQIDERLEISGNVNLILCDGATLTCTHGVHLTSGASLTIWGQEFDTGKLVTMGDEKRAGIGGGEDADGGSVYIYAGDVTATGTDWGAGIGGGNNGSGGTTTISGGTVHAFGGEASNGGGGWYRWWRRRRGRNRYHYECEDQGRGNGWKVRRRHRWRRRWRRRNGLHLGCERQGNGGLSCRSYRWRQRCKWRQRYHQQRRRGRGHGNIRKW